MNVFYRMTPTNFNFKNTKEILDTYNLSFKFEKFIDYASIISQPASKWFLEDLDFSLSNRGTADKEFFNSEFIVVPFLKETWKRHAKGVLNVIFAECEKYA